MRNNAKQRRDNLRRYFNKLVMSNAFRVALFECSRVRLTSSNFIDFPLRCLLQHLSMLKKMSTVIIQLYNLALFGTFTK